MLRLWFVALAHSSLGQFMQNSRWGFAAVEAIHLLALTLLGGSVLVLDLRLLGLILRRESPRMLNRDLSRILLSSLAILVLTGVALVSEEALKCYYNAAFRWKMALLAAAVLFYFTLYRRVVLTLGSAATLASRITAVVSLSLWLGVGVAGRAIGLI
ncbi:hypothetical protein FTW19_03740 [Terriglobus albidus]|uniref:DUF6644 domain-containing protein n=1 Tax=Terriglobus albidus TaxID=1592106 RepID=A0A5B9E9U2_9BACT|nr:DUF6644 family protein [Terriglobus albidus]QEE27201.1 hypothetical protein FTW19_03740 [Terriglobus albidus]